MELNKLPLMIIAVAFLAFNAFMVCRHYRPRCSDCGRRATADLLVVEDPATGINRCAPCLHRHLFK